MSSHEPSAPSWLSVLAWLVVGIVCVQALASVLPRLIVPIAVLAVIVAVLRLVWFHTRKW